MTLSGRNYRGVDRGPLLNIINWISLVATCILCMVKVTSKWVLVHQIQPDDTCMVVAMVNVFSNLETPYITHELTGSQFGAVGYGVALSYEVSAGLGRGTQYLEAHNIHHFEQVSVVSTSF